MKWRRLSLFASSPRHPHISRVPSEFGLPPSQFNQHRSNGSSNISLMWLRLFEVWLIQRLLRSPTFHRGVRVVHKKVHELRHGKDPAEMGGTNIDDPSKVKLNRFLKFYLEELRDQIRGSAKK